MEVIHITFSAEILFYLKGRALRKIGIETSDQVIRFTCDSSRNGVDLFEHLNFKTWNYYESFITFKHMREPYNSAL